MIKSRYIFALFVILVLTGFTAVQAASNATLPAQEPWPVHLIDLIPEFDTGSHLSIASHPVTGQVFISYYDSYNQNLRLAYQVPQGVGNCGPGLAWMCMTLDSAGDVGTYSSVDVAVVQRPSPNPPFTRVGISYYDATNASLKYAEFSMDTPSPSWTYQFVDTGVLNFHDKGNYSSLKFDSQGLPHIAYHVYDVTSLFPEPHYSHSVYLAEFVGGGGGSGCTGGNNWYCQYVDSRSDQSGFGYYISLDINWQDVPMLAYYDPIGKDLYFAYYDVSHWDKNILDNGGTGDVGKFVTLYAPKTSLDQAQLAYYDATNGMVKYAKYVGIGGNCTYPGNQFSCSNVESIGINLFGNVGLSITVDPQLKPVIAYMDASEEYTPAQLKIARPPSAYGLVTGNCGPSNTWQCTILDYGASETDEADWAAVTLSPAGYGTVAYHEFDYFYGEGRLKIAQQLQPYSTFLPLIKR